MRKKKNYKRPLVTLVAMKSELLNSYSGQHKPGVNNGQTGDAKGNNFFFDDEEEDE